MNLLKKIVLLTLVFFGINTIVAQQIQKYYYYKGQKVFLKLDTKRISIALKDKDLQSVLSQVDLGKGIVKPSEIVEDHPSTLFYENSKDLNFSNAKSFYGELSSNVNKTEREYVQEMVAYNKASNVILASPSFKTKEGKKIGLTNKFYVKLQKSSDISILLKQVKEKGITVIGRDKFMSLWYVVSVDKSTNKNALILANEFYETKLFAESEPAFIYHNLSSSNDPYYKNQWSLKNTDQNGVRNNITFSKTMTYELGTHKEVSLPKSTRCIPTILVISNVNSGNSDVRKASNSIIAKNTIFRGGVAEYQAGKKIVLTSGFKAVQGSKFSARIANCITSSNSEEIVKDDYIVDTDVFNLEKAVENNLERIDKTENYVVVPNPTTDEVKILHNFNLKEEYSVELYDFSGKVILRKSINSDNNVISLAKFNSGIYVIKIVNKENISVKKIMLKK